MNLGLALHVLIDKEATKIMGCDSRDGGGAWNGSEKKFQFPLKGVFLLE